MLLPIGIGQVSIGTGIAAVNHHVVAYIQAAVGNAAYIVAHGSLEEDHVAGAGVLWPDRIAVPVQTCRTHVTDVVHAGGSEQPADETGAVEGCGRVIAAPHIGIAQAFIGSFHQKGKLRIGIQQFLRHIVAQRFLQFGQISELGIEACTNQACAALQILADDVRLSQYVKSYFQYGYENLRQKAKGGQQPNLNQTIIAETLIAIPPYQETKRIMDSVYQCIDQINTIEESLESICTSIENAKKRILDLAIHGQLVPQNPADEPATVLLDRIRAEKEELIRQGKIKRDKKESVIFRGDDNSYYEKVGEAVSCIDELIPFELPEGWAWVRGYSCFSGMESKRPAGVDFDYIDIDSIDNRNHVITEPKHMAVHDAPSRASRAVRAGSVLFSLVRPYLQNIAYIPEEYSSCIASTGFYVCNSSGALIPEFMFYLMLSPYVVNGLNQFMKGDNSPSISKDDIENWLYPIPPIAEQKRIVIHVQKALEQTSLIASSLS